MNKTHALLTISTIGIIAVLGVGIAGVYSAFNTPQSQTELATLNVVNEVDEEPEINAADTSPDEPVVIKSPSLPSGFAQFSGINNYSDFLVPADVVALSDGFKSYLREQGIYPETQAVCSWLHTNENGVWTFYLSAPNNKAWHVVKFNEADRTFSFERVSDPATLPDVNDPERADSY